MYLLDYRKWTASIVVDGSTATAPIPAFMRLFYPAFFETKLFLRDRTLVGRLAKGSRLELTDAN